MGELVFVKLGGSFITNKERPMSLNPRALEAASAAVAAALGRVRLLLGNGGGSFAHYAVKALEGSPPSRLVPICQAATRLLNGLVVDHLLAQGVPAVSVQTSAIIFEGDSGLEVNPGPVRVALESGLVPVVYGECLPSRGGYRVLSTERVFEALAPSLRPSRVVLLMDVAGVFTCDPKKCRGAEPIERVDEANAADVLELLRGAGGSDATGGVYGKVASMIELSKALGVPVALVSGFDIESAVNAMLGRLDRVKGTVIDFSRPHAK